MEEGIAAAIILSGVVLGNFWLWFFGVVMLLLLAALAYVAAERPRRRALSIRIFRSKENPVLLPNRETPWESEAEFNPAVYYDGNTVHLLYGALGQDGISRLGYASSRDGIHFERLSHPVYTPHVPTPEKYRNPFTSPARLQYDRVLYASGGG